MLNTEYSLYRGIHHVNYVCTLFSVSNCKNLAYLSSCGSLSLEVIFNVCFMSTLQIFNITSETGSQGCSVHVLRDNISFLFNKNIGLGLLTAIVSKVDVHELNIIAVLLIIIHLYHFSILFIQR